VPSTKKWNKNNKVMQDASDVPARLNGSLVLISTTAQMARSLAYRDGSMARVFAYRRRLKWLARSHIATAQWLTCSHIDDGSNGSLARISRRLNGSITQSLMPAQSLIVEPFLRYTWSKGRPQGILGSAGRSNLVRVEGEIVFLVFFPTGFFCFFGVLFVFLLHHPFLPFG
jgi:hypothetical protein